MMFLNTCQFSKDDIVFGRVKSIVVYFRILRLLYFHKILMTKQITVLKE